MNIKQILFLFIISQFLLNCSLNKIFVQPYPNKKENTEFKWKENNDSISVKFIGENFQPTFKKNNDTLNFPFKIESVFFKSGNNNLLNGWFLIPKNGKPKATIFHLHGNAGNLISQYQTISELTKDGYQIFMFDYSGFGYSEGKPTRKNCLIDSFSAFKYLLKSDKIKDTKVIIYGQSLGGNLAIPLANKMQNKISGLVLEGTFLNAKNIGSHYLPLIGDLVVKNYYNNNRNIKEYKKPILVIHSKEDSIIPMKLGRKIYENANQQKEFYEVTGYHINSTKIYHKEIAYKIEKMLN